MADISHVKSQAQSLLSASDLPDDHRSALQEVTGYSGSTAPSDKHAQFRAAVDAAQTALDNLRRTS